MSYAGIDLVVWLKKPIQCHTAWLDHSIHKKIKKGLDHAIKSWDDIKVK